MTFQQGLLDTSIFIASETGRALDVANMPAEVAASVVTVAELHAGVLAASDTATRARRLATLDTLSDIEVIPIDEGAARAWAHLRVHLAERGRRINVNDLWIAATALSRGIPVVTQDNDFDAVVGVAGLSVIRV
ncbi:MAG TPA: type II toxin-antitoxin system VapC family toxin [Micromonosporaceae bacterium]|jgi:predicted nucleic acid-binding protein